MKRTLFLLSLIPISCLFGCSNKNNKDLSTPLTFTCNKDGGKLVLAHVIQNVEPHATNISWQVNGGETQSYTFNTTEATSACTLGENLKTGDKITVRGDNKGGFTFYEKTADDEKYCVNEFITNQEDDFSISGNIMSLISKNNFAGLKTIPAGSGFAYLFSTHFISGYYCKISDASKLLLPATKITPFCYNNMFKESELIDASIILPAVNLPDYCYNFMFSENHSLVQGPKMPKTRSLSRCCCQSMFYFCGSLTGIEMDFSNANPNVACFYNMFCGCESLKKAVKLSDKSLARHCYYQMYEGCKNLTVSKTAGTKIFTCPDTTGVDDPTLDMFWHTKGDAEDTPVAGATYYYVE